MPRAARNARPRLRSIQYVNTILSTLGVRGNIYRTEITDIVFLSRLSRTILKGPVRKSDLDLLTSSDLDSKSNLLVPWFISDHSITFHEVLILLFLSVIFVHCTKTSKDIIKLFLDLVAPSF